MGDTTELSDGDKNEFEGMTPRELRNLVRSLQDDLRRAVEDRAKLLEVCRELMEGLHDDNVFVWLIRVKGAVTDVEGIR